MDSLVEGMGVILFKEGDSNGVFATDLTVRKI